MRLLCTLPLVLRFLLERKQSFRFVRSVEHLSSGLQHLTGLYPVTCKSYSLSHVSYCTYLCTYIFYLSTKHHANFKKYDCQNYIIKKQHRSCSTFKYARCHNIQDQNLLLRSCQVSYLCCLLEQ